METATIVLYAVQIRLQEIGNGTGMLVSHQWFQTVYPFEFSPLAYNSGFLTHSLEVLLAILNAKSPLLYLLLLVGGCRLCLPSYQSDAIVHDL